MAIEEWSSNDDIQFANRNKFEEEMEGLLHTTEKNLIQSGIKGKNYELEEEEIPVEETKNNSDLAISSVPDQIDFPKEKPGPLTQHPQRNQTPCILYPRQIAYGSRPLLKVTNTQAKSTGSQKKLAKFVSSHTAKSNK